MKDEQFEEIRRRLIALDNHLFTVFFFVILTLLFAATTFFIACRH